MADDEQVRAGAWSSLTGGTAELMARSGAAFVVLDAQHGFYDGGSLATTLVQWGSLTTPVFVRVADQSMARIGRVLDLGASGVIVPLVDSAIRRRRWRRAAATRRWGYAVGVR